MSNIPPPHQIVTLDQIFIKMVLDSQNNINKLIAIQEQQMIYINTLLSKIENEQRQQQYHQPTNPQENETQQPPAVTTTGTTTTTEQSGSGSGTDQPSDTKSITKKH